MLLFFSVYKKKLSVMTQKTLTICYYAYHYYLYHPRNLKPRLFLWFILANKPNQSIAPATQRVSLPTWGPSNVLKKNSSVVFGVIGNRELIICYEWLFQTALYLCEKWMLTWKTVVLDNLGSLWPDRGLHGFDLQRPGHFSHNKIRRGPTKGGCSINVT